MKKTILLLLLSTSALVFVFFTLSITNKKQEPPKRKIHPREFTATSNIVNENSPNPPPLLTPISNRNDSLFVNDLLGRFNYRSDSKFISVESKYCSKPMYLQKETYKKFKEMHEAAKKDGITLIIISGTRNFTEQKGIWDGKWGKYIASMDSLSAAKTILRFSSMPSTSRHHWGTAIDINSLDNSYFASGKGLKEYEWLKQNAARFGFCQVYTDKGSTQRKGYEMEKWHWSYLPIAKTYLKKYNEIITYKDINGFTGSYLAPKLRAIEDYVNGIDAVCH